MGFFDRLKGEFIDVIEWTTDDNDLMVYRFERYNNEIKYGAQLTVRESQAAVFVHKGQIADVFNPGMYELQTENLPLLSTMQGWKYGFQSPFKAEVYFVSTKRFTDLKWGTPSPILMRDTEFGPIRLRARGAFSIRIKKPDMFIKEITGTDSEFSTDEVIGQLRNVIVSRFTDALAESKIHALDLATKYDELGDFATNKLKTEFSEYGLDLLKILIENITLPDAVNDAIDKRASMGVLGNMQNYTQFQAANAMEDAAKNPSGGASDGIGMGMGFGMAQQMANAQFSQQKSTPPPVPTLSLYIAVNGQQTGPFDIGGLKAKVSSGELTPETMVWKQGMAAWGAAKELPELSDLFGSAPPPLPPSM